MSSETKILTESYDFGLASAPNQEDYAPKIFLNAYETASFIANIMISGSGNNGLRWAVEEPVSAKLDGVVNGKSTSNNAWTIGTLKTVAMKLGEKFHTNADPLNKEVTNHQFLFSIQNHATSGYVWISGSRGGSSGDYRVLTGSFIECVKM